MSTARGERRRTARIRATGLFRSARSLAAVACVLAALGASAAAAGTVPFDPAGPSSVNDVEEALDRAKALGRERRHSEAAAFAARAVELAREAYGEADARTARALYALGVAEFRAGRAGAAVDAFRAALAAWDAAGEGGSVEAARTANNLAFVLAGEGDAEAAADLYLRAIDAYAGSVGIEHPEYGTANRNLARLYAGTGEDDRAESRFRTALAAYESGGEANDRLVDAVLVDLAKFYRDRRRPREAVAPYRRLLALRERRYGPDHPRTFETLADLGGLYEELGRFSEAEPLFRRLLEAGERRGGPEHPDLVPVLESLAFAVNAEGRGEEADALLRRVLRIREKAFGPDHPAVGETYYKLGTLALRRRDWTAADERYRKALRIFAAGAEADHPYLSRIPGLLGWVNRELGRTAEAVRFFRQALAAVEAKGGRGSSEWIVRALDLAGLLFWNRQDREAERLYADVLDVLESTGSPDLPRRADVVEHLAILAAADGRTEEAESLYLRTLALRGSMDPPDTAAHADTLLRLGVLYLDTGRHAEAETRLRAALEMRERLEDRDGPGVVPTLTALADLYAATGRERLAAAMARRIVAVRRRAGTPEELADALGRLARTLSRSLDFPGAVEAAREAVSVVEAAFGPDDGRLVDPLNDLSAIYQDHGDYVAAAERQRRILGIVEADPEADPLLRARTLNNLGVIFMEMGRDRKAVPLLERARDIVAEVEGRGTSRYAAALTRLGRAYTGAGRVEEGLAALEEAYRVARETLPAGAPGLAYSLNDLASARIVAGDIAGGADLLERAGEIFREAFGEDHPLRARSLANLAVVRLLEGRVDEARRAAARSRAIFRARFGPAHPDRIAAAVLEALLAASEGDVEAALAEMRFATDGIRRRGRVSARTRPVAAFGERLSSRWFFFLHVALADRLARDRPERRDDLLAEAFEVSQLADVGATAAAVAGLAARFGAGDDALARLVRDRQDAAEAWRRLDRALLAAAARGDARRDRDEERKQAAEQAALEARLAELDRRLAEEFPEYAELAAPRPITLDRLQALLAPDEALVMYRTVRRPPAGPLRRLVAPITTAATQLWVVRRDRVALSWLDIDREDLDDAVAELRAGLDPGGFDPAAAAADAEGLPPFDLGAAHRLYRVLFAPAEPLLDGARHVMVVPDGGLRSLPLAVLVTDPPAAGATYAEAAWLARRYAMSVLPSAASLRALRRFARASRAPRPFAGFGDPALEGRPGDGRGLRPQTLFLRGGTADSEAVRRLPPLPETADELGAIAAALGAGPSSLYLREAASEKQVKEMRLADYRILAFATHGLTAGEFGSIAEPALVLTPPAAPSPDDDGLLTASEIAGLRLDADWVVLSACNTAAPDGTPGAEGLSGLARAFFHAGSRALLVSHWPVSSRAAVRLTTGMFRAAAAAPGLGRAGALRRSMLALLDTPGFAHPALWAPFVVVGEGGPPAPGGR